MTWKLVRTGIAGVVQETTTFLLLRTSLGAFERGLLREGAEIFGWLSESGTDLAGWAAFGAPPYRRSI